MSADSPDSGDQSSSDALPSEILPGYPTIQDFTKQGFKTLMEAIRQSNALPSGRDFNFYNTFEAFPRIINEQGISVLKSMNQILRYNGVDCNIRSRIPDEKTELVIEANDVILEKVEDNIEDLLGIRIKTGPEPIVMQTVSAQLPINGSWNRTGATFSVSDTAQAGKSGLRANNCIKLITAKNIVRPQKFFKDKVDNSNKYPWEPRIKDKPNSLKPLALFLEEYEDRQEFSHPYECELDRFTPMPSQLARETPKPPKSISETPLVQVENEKQLNSLIEVLRNCTEIAVDVEHHSYRTFMGITCLLQISTPESDYLIDTLTLRDKLHVLNEIFTKNSIVKIFHGADKDIEWLQRDLSLYVVNMFDTHQAAKILEYSALSLAYLMKRFCNVIPDKQFQLADWRIRPLPEEFKNYAREDTHYLLYIYKKLKNELLKKGEQFLQIALDRSTEICKKRYFKPVLTEDSHLGIYRRAKKMFDNRQLYALKEIYGWRDRVAREEDESLGYVLPNHMLLQISETLPREMQGILACCNPIPPLVRSNLLDLHNIILKAREQPLEKAVLKENTTGRGILKTAAKINVDSPLYCPHDLTETNEFRDDLPTLLSLKITRIDTERTLNSILEIEKVRSCYSVFDTPDNSDDEAVKKRETSRGVAGFSKFLSPYERYKLVRPFVRAEEDRLEAQKKREEAEERMIEADTRTDDERIAGIREHFLTMSRKFSEELEDKRKKEEAEAEIERAKSLREMAGSRKRKREASSGDEQEIKDEDRLINEEQLQTPFPNKHLRFMKNFNSKQQQHGVKRKFDDTPEEIEKDRDIQDRRENKKRGAKKFKNQNRNRQTADVDFNQHNRQNQRQGGDQRGFSNKKKQPKSRNQQQQNSNQTNQQQKRNNRNKGRQDTSFVPYDYSSVDFRQFQGGAGSASGGAQIKKPGFKVKGQKGKRMGNRGNKAATFANTNRGRGRGR